MKLSNFNSIHTITSLIIISILLNSFILTNQTKTKTNTKQLTLDGLENPNDLLIPDSLDTSSEEDNELGFLQKGTKTKIKKEVSFNPYSGSGFIDPSVMRVNRKDNEIYRFKQNVNPDDEFENVNLANSDPNVPPKDLQFIKNEYTSNGILLAKGKRTVNFSTGKHDHY